MLVAVLVGGSLIGTTVAWVAVRAILAELPITATMPGPDRYIREIRFNTAEFKLPPRPGDPTGILTAHLFSPYPRD